MNASEEVHSKSKLTVPHSPFVVHDTEYIAARNKMKSFLFSLRQNGFLLTEQEFKDRQIYPVIAKKHEINRVVGRHCINTALKILGLQKIRLPKKYLVLKSGAKHITLSKKLFSKDLTIYATQILEEYRRLSFQETQELICLVLATGYSDCYRRNLITTKSHVYVVDTELKDFFPLDPNTEHLQFLKNSVKKEDQDAFSEELNKHEFRLSKTNSLCAQLTECLGYPFEFSLEEFGI